MAGLASLLSDPNYTGANDATKQAIFDKFAPQDPNFTGANPETQLAIRSKFGLVAAPSGGIPVGRGVGQIPTEPGANLAPTVAAPQTLGQKIMGYVETPFAVGANLASGPVTYLAGAGGPEFQRKVAGQIQYQPRTQQAQNVLEAIGSAAEASKIPPFMPGMNFGQSLTPAVRAVGDVGRAEGSLVGNALAVPLAARAARAQEGRVAQSYAAAPVIDATQAAQRIGGVVPPAISNPTTANVIKGKLVGPEMQTKFAKINETAVTDAVRTDLGLAPSARLNAAAVDQALDMAGKPYEIVKKIPVLTPDADVIAQLQSLKKPASAVSKGRIETSNALIDNMTAEISQGRSGVDVLNDIRTLRKEAIDVYKRRDKGINPPTAPELAEAEARMGIATAYEKLIDANVTDPNVLANIQAARTKQAQIYQHARALDYGQEKIDPQTYVKMYEESKGQITGVGADIAKAAAVFPDYFTLTPTEIKGFPRLSRGGIGATIGAALGAPLGPAGSVAGLATGMALGTTASGVLAKRMATPAYQAAHAIPQDFRPPVNMLRPVEPNLTPNALVPYDYSQAAFTPPNFVIPQAPLREAPLMSSPMARELPAPAAGGPMAGFRAEEARAGTMSRTLGQQAEADAAAAQAAGRQPTRGGTPMVFDEQGKLIPADQTLRGATPNIQVIESTGKSLSGAADILASGRSPALMSAEQKIAWEKTKVDLADIVPGMKALNDKAIASKMLDRAWVEGAITKARDKAAAFDEMSKRATGAQAIRDAVINREKMLDAAEMLQEQLGSRPVSSGSQGPKTQAAQRNKNAMRPTDADIKNALIGK